MGLRVRGRQEFLESFFNALQLTRFFRFKADLFEEHYRVDIKHVFKYTYDGTASMGYSSSNTGEILIFFLLPLLPGCI
ncbi:unnamed protein product [Allacma fusca]|uniref:Uncharacterized protein n=1 Tax=Allacma fusca TaxID=39272 RepID=A0A8J2KG91_9HEXA|nr:unnamed protein product [Allacma fusca]